MKYRREIDGLRAVAVLPVILFHAGFSAFSGGYVGVDIFFVISGYLITTIILAEKEKGTFSLVNFYERRARRILPALFFVILCCFPFAWLWLLPNHLRDFSQSVTAVSLFSSNILFWRESGYFATAAELKPLLHTWSLAVEEQYYILFPLFLMLMWKLRKRWIFSSLILVAVGSLALAQYGAYNHPSATFYLLPTRGWELAIGALIAFYFLYKKDHQEFVSSSSIASEVFGLLGLVLIGYSIVAFDKSTPFPGFYALIPTVGTGLIIIFTTPRTLVGRFLGTKVMVGIGLISYSTYLWHQPLFVFARHRSMEELSVSLLITLSLMSILLAYLSWKYVEMPFRNKEVFNRKRIFAFSFIGSMFLAVVGGVGHLENGFAERLDSEVAKVAYPQSGRAEGCDEEKWTPTGVTCVVGDVSVRPTIVLLGDSHANTLTKGLSEYLSKDNKSLTVYAQSWCAPLIDVATDDPNKLPKCRNYISSAFEAVAKDENIETVILFAEWANYTQGKRWGEDEPSFYTDSLSTSKSLEENVRVFRRGVQRTIDFLSNSGKRIIVIGSVPEYEVLIPDILSRKVYFGGEMSLPEMYILNRTDYLSRNKGVILGFEDEAISRKIEYINPYDLMCNEGGCEYLDSNNNPLYIDSNHLSYYGANYILNSFTNEIN